MEKRLDKTPSFYIILNKGLASYREEVVDETNGEKIKTYQQALFIKTKRR
jgi:hypothetical protein